MFAVGRVEPATAAAAARAATATLRAAAAATSAARAAGRQDCRAAIRCYRSSASASLLSVWPVCRSACGDLECLIRARRAATSRPARLSASLAAVSRFWRTDHELAAAVERRPRSG